VLLIVNSFSSCTFITQCSRCPVLSRVCATARRLTHQHAGAWKRSIASSHFSACLLCCTSDTVLPTDTIRWWSTDHN